MLCNQEVNYEHSGGNRWTTRRRVELLRNVLEEVSAEWTRRIGARFKPFEQTTGMEALLARLALTFRQLVVGSMDDGETNHAVLQSFKLLINISFPKRQGIK